METYGNYCNLYLGPPAVFNVVAKLSHPNHEGDVSISEESQTLPSLIIADLLDKDTNLHQNYQTSECQPMISLNMFETRRPMEEWQVLDNCDVDH